MDSQVIRFHNAQAFSGLTGVVDHNNATIHGVSLITSNMEAEGHGLYVDNKTVDQLFDLAKSMGKLPVTMDHEGGINEVNGYIHNFRKDGNHLRGDWCLLKTHEDTATMLERAERQPGTFGLSVAFKGPSKGVTEGGKSRARAEKLLSADVVKRPACNPNGLFAAKDEPISLSKKDETVDTDKNGMAEITNEQIYELLSQLSQKVDAQEQIISQLQNGQQEDGIDADTLLSLHNASDEELAELGLTRDEVDAAVNDAVTSGELSYEGDAQGEEGGEEGSASAGVEGGVAAGEMAAAGAGEGASFAALQKELISLKAKINAKEASEKSQAEAIEFAEIESKIDILAAQRDEAIALSEGLAARCEALELAYRTGTRPVTAGVDTGVRLFGANHEGELHPFQARIKQLVADKTCKSEAEAIQFASKENPASHKDWIASQTQRL